MREGKNNEPYSESSLFENEEDNVGLIFPKLEPAYSGRAFKNLTRKKNAEHNWSHWTLNIGRVTTHTYFIFLLFVAIFFVVFFLLEINCRFAKAILKYICRYLKHRQYTPTHPNTQANWKFFMGFPEKYVQYSIKTIFIYIFHFLCLPLYGIQVCCCKIAILYLQL